MKKHSQVALALVIITVALATVAIAANPFVGTWELNLAKSKYNPGPADKGETVRIEAIDNGLKHSFDTVDAEGKATHSENAARYDGKDYPTTGDPNSDTVAMKKIDANTFEHTYKKAGKEVGRWRVTVSKDGKTLTAIGKGKNAKGQDSTATLVYDRQ